MKMKGKMNAILMMMYFFSLINFFVQSEVFTIQEEFTHDITACKPISSTDNIQIRLRTTYTHGDIIKFTLVNETLGSSTSVAQSSVFVIQCNDNPTHNECLEQAIEKKTAINTIDRATVTPKQTASQFSLSQSAYYTFDSSQIPKSELPKTVVIMTKHLCSLSRFLFDNEPVTTKSAFRVYYLVIRDEMDIGFSFRNSVNIDFLETSIKYLRGGNFDGGKDLTSIRSVPLSNSKNVMKASAYFGDKVLFRGATLNAQSKILTISPTSNDVKFIDTNQLGIVDGSAISTARYTLQNLPALAGSFLEIVVEPCWYGNGRSCDSSGFFPSNAESAFSNLTGLEPPVIVDNVFGRDLFGAVVNPKPNKVKFRFTKDFTSANLFALPESYSQFVIECAKDNRVLDPMIRINAQIVARGAIKLRVIDCSIQVLKTSGLDTHFDIESSVIDDFTGNNDFKFQARNSVILKASDKARVTTIREKEANGVIVGCDPVPTCNVARFVSLQSVLNEAPLNQTILNTTRAIFTRVTFEPDSEKDFINYLSLVECTRQPDPNVPIQVYARKAMYCASTNGFISKDQEVALLRRLQTIALTNFQTDSEFQNIAEIARRRMLLLAEVRYDSVKVSKTTPNMIIDEFALEGKGFAYIRNQMQTVQAKVETMSLDYKIILGKKMIAMGETEPALQSFLVPFQNYNEVAFENLFKFLSDKNNVDMLIARNQKELAEKEQQILLDKGDNAAELASKQIAAFNSELDRLRKEIKAKQALNLFQSIVNTMFGLGTIALGAVKKDPQAILDGVKETFNNLFDLAESSKAIDEPGIEELNLNEITEALNRIRLALDSPQQVLDDIKNGKVEQSKSAITLPKTEILSLTSKLSGAIERILITNKLDSEKGPILSILNTLGKAMEEAMDDLSSAVSQQLKIQGFEFAETQLNSLSGFNYKFQSERAVRTSELAKQLLLNVSLVELSSIVLVEGALNTLNVLCTATSYENPNFLFDTNGGWYQACNIDGRKNMKYNLLSISSNLQTLLQVVDDFYLNKEITDKKSFFRADIEVTNLVNLCALETQINDKDAVTDSVSFYLSPENIPNNSPLYCQEQVEIRWIGFYLTDDENPEELSTPDDNSATQLELQSPFTKVVNSKNIEFTLPNFKYSLQYREKQTRESLLGLNNFEDPGNGVIQATPFASYVVTRLGGKLFKTGNERAWLQFYYSTGSLAANCKVETSETLKKLPKRTDCRNSSLFLRQNNAQVALIVGLVVGSVVFAASAIVAYKKRSSISKLLSQYQQRQKKGKKNALEAQDLLKNNHQLVSSLENPGEMTHSNKV